MSARRAEAFHVSAVVRTASGQDPIVTQIGNPQALGDWLAFLIAEGYENVNVMRVRDGKLVLRYDTDGHDL